MSATDDPTAGRLTSLQQATITLTQDDLDRVVERVSQRAASAVTAAEPAGTGDDDVVVVRLTNRELREIREAAQFYARAGYGLAFLEKLGKWLAAVGAVGIAIKMLFPQLFSGGRP